MIKELFLHKSWAIQKMHIKHVEIGNFRKLKAVRIDFASQTTVFVGANNSGKTSAMVALRRFLSDRSNFSINDFTLSHWPKIDAIAAKWESATDGKVPEPIEWDCFTPFLDVWLDVPARELHYVQKFLPTLDWDGTLIGVRLRFEPKDAQALQHEYLMAKRAAGEVMAKVSEANNSDEKSDSVSTFALWPRSMMEFLTRKMRSIFEVRAYLLDPAKLEAPNGDGMARIQILPENSDPIEGADPFHSLIRIDEISAQRGVVQGASRDNDSHEDFAKPRTGKKLSSQLRNYYTQHLDPFDTPEPTDLEALLALHEAQTVFGKRLADCFSDALTELGGIGYPGITDPKLTITTNIRPIDGLNHDSAVQYEVPTCLAGSEGVVHRLPED